MNEQYKLSKINRIDRIVKQFIKNTNVPGLAVGVVDQYEILLAKGYGVKNMLTQEPVNEQTLFHMASVSKTFVACAVTKLIQQGSLSLESRIASYIPYFKLADSRYEDITVRHLLCHTSGLPDEEQYPWDTPVYEDYALEQYVRGLRSKKLEGSPGERFSYSNIGYEILGNLISRVSGVPFETYMKENILEPMGMKHSNYYKPNVRNDQLSSPHVFEVRNDYCIKVSDIFPYHRAHAPSSTLLSSAEDMCWSALSYLQVNRDRMNKGGNAISRESHQELWSTQAETGWGGYMSHVGLSWFHGKYKDTKVYSHAGMDTGFRSNFIIMPELGAGIAVMSNAYHVGIQVLCRTIMDILLGEKPDSIPYSAARPLAETMVHQGLDEAICRYKQMQSSSEFIPLLIMEGEFEALGEEFIQARREHEADLWKELCRFVFPVPAQVN
ncbi:beta-lactamase family protein [Neobacillus mesonae]|nr:beta-lactamase family protein [Neobacillus mesonae]